MIRHINALLMVFGSCLVALMQGCDQHQPYHHERIFEQPPEVTAGTLLEIQGINPGNREHILVIRLDDKAEPGFSDRVNLERVIPPGRFRIQTPIMGLKTPSGRVFDAKQLTRLIAFADEQSGMIIETSRFRYPQPLGHGAKGWDLGKTTSPVWPGFSLLTPDSPLLNGSMLNAIDRGEKKQAADALTFDGIRGIETMTLPLPAGQWFVTLWIRDPGEWEYLPHPLNIQINAEGKTVYQQQLTPEAWINDQYLNGIQREPQPMDSSWRLFGQRRSHRISFAVEVDQDGMQLQFSGDQPEAGFVAAVLAEPDSLYPTRYNIESKRSQWWDENWPIEAWPIFSQAITDYQLHGFWLEPRRSLKTTTAPDTWVTFDVLLHHRGMPGQTNIQMTSLTQNAVALRPVVRWGQWQIRRTRLSSTLLRPDNDYLRTGELPPENHPQPRRLHIAVNVPANTPPGTYSGTLKVQIGQRVLSKPVSIEVSDVRLPAADRPIGVYLDRAPHLDWFESTRQEAEEQIQCDLHHLQQLGITGISPPLPTPDKATSHQQFIEQMAALHQHGFLPPILAYTPFKRLLAGQGKDRTFQTLATMNHDLGSHYLSTPAWVTADEPSNPGGGASIGDIRHYRAIQPPNSILAGHLNHKGDRQYADAFDLVLINDGYGASRQHIETLQRQADVWLYNLANRERPANLRAAAGFFLWRVHADGFIQWHARMPTADPFDPTDGRESDVQFFYPSLLPCSPDIAPELDASLFQLVEGIQDLRWLLWLEYQAKRRTDAQSLLQEVTRIIPDDWEIMKTVSQRDLNDWRQKIIELSLKKHP